jgi:transcriptional regulator with XRE-family HTH domain
MRSPTPPTGLRRARLLAGLRIIDLKEATGLSRQSLWRFETGLGHPKAATRQKLAAVLGAKEADLFKQVGR